MNAPLYLSGPMSGYPQFNIPAFDAAAWALRALGYNIISPSELDDPCVRDRCMRSIDGAPISEPGMPTWGNFIGRDIRVLLDSCSGIVLLNGWEESRGSKIEVCAGLHAGFVDFLRWNGRSLCAMPKRTVVELAMRTPEDF